MSNNKHNMYGSKTYKSWSEMKQRCSNKNNTSYKNYGQRGIKYCECWEDFNNFYKDMGERPENTSLDRIDVNGDYNLSNCRWATRKAQARNTRKNHYFTYNGETMILADFADKYNIKKSTLSMRIYCYKWSIDKALNYMRGGMTYR